MGFCGENFSRLGLRDADLVDAEIVEVLDLVDGEREVDVLQLVDGGDPVEGDDLVNRFPFVDVSVVVNLIWAAVDGGVSERVRREALAGLVGDGELDAAHAVLVHYACDRSDVRDLVVGNGDGWVNGDALGLDLGAGLALLHGLAVFFDLGPTSIP